MSENTSILLTGRSREQLETLSKVLENQPGFKLTTKLNSNGHVDPMHGVAQNPNVLVLVLSDLWEQELQAFNARPAIDRPPAIIVGPAGDTSIMRMAMKGGARDYFTLPIVAEELIVSLRQIADDANTSRARKKGKVTAVINAKGGSGASFISCNLAHLLTMRSQNVVALLDMDMQFGTLPLYLDVVPQDNLYEALRVVNELDPVALDAQMIKHKSGLHLLASSAEKMRPTGSIKSEQVVRLLDIAQQSYDRLIIDLPRQIDPLTLAVLQRADHVLLAMQQSLSHIRDAKRMHRMMTTDLGVPENHINLIVNRYSEKSTVAIVDIQEALPGLALTTIPSDFKQVSESINFGVPIFEIAPKAAITKSLKGIIIEMDGEDDAARQGFFKNTFANFFSL